MTRKKLQDAAICDAPSGAPVLYPQDAIVEYSPKGAKNLTDEEGLTVWHFPSGWTEQQIAHSLAFANWAHNKGVRKGQYDKVREIQRCLTCD